MKVFQIIDGFCHWDASAVLRRAADAVGRFPESDLFVDAPDRVFEGWGFDSSLEGDARFVQPIPPEGWLYDEGTGTFYREGDEPGATPDVWDELAKAYAEGVNAA